MTVKQYAVKYDIPLGRVKAAMGHRKGGINTKPSYIAPYEAAIEYEEETLKEKMFDYLFRDLMSCLECMHEDKQQMDRIASRKNSGEEGAK